MVRTSRTKPFAATAVDGKVLLDGPGIADTFDPSAASETADELHDAAGKAREQAADQAPNSGPSSSG
jgi:hypothetical protein